MRTTKRRRSKSRRSKKRRSKLRRSKSRRSKSRQTGGARTTRDDPTEIQLYVVDTINPEIDRTLVEMQNRCYPHEQPLDSMSDILLDSQCAYIQVKDVIYAMCTISNQGPMIRFANVCSSKKGGCKILMQQLLQALEAPHKPIYITYEYIRHNGISGRNIASCKCYYDVGFRYVNYDSDSKKLFKDTYKDTNDTFVPGPYGICQVRHREPDGPDGQDGTEYHTILMAHKDTIPIGDCVNLDSIAYEHPCTLPYRWETGETRPEPDESE